MTTFIIVTPDDNSKLEDVRAAVERVFPGNWTEFGQGQFAASGDEMTSESVSKLLDPARGSIGRFAVFTVAGHHGWHRKDLWEWLSSRGTP